MASVTSLDHDMRKLRLERYSLEAANEARQWIENTLGETLPSGDLMDILKDGVALCRLVNMVSSPGVRFKASNMPFVQMENISHFLRACEMPPLNLPAHDRFLTVDLFDQKDPAQVLQCIAAFSRRANNIKPAAFPTTIGAKSKGGAMSPQGTGGGHTKSPSYTINAPPPKIEPQIAFNPLNKAAYASGRTSPTKQSSLSRGGLAPPEPVSSWSKTTDESKTAPAWNIHQYGYMGGASQGNQGVAFGSRRQITSQGPEVPSLAEKEKRIRQREEEEIQRQKLQAEQEEAAARQEEQRRWEEETRMLKEREIQAEEEHRQLTAKNERALKEQEAYEAKIATQRLQQRQVSDSRLNGQFLSQYQAETKPEANEQSVEAKRIADLERQLAEMKEAEKKRQEIDRQIQKGQEDSNRSTIISKPDLVASSEPPLDSVTSHEDDWDSTERDYLKKQQQMYSQIAAEQQPHTSRKTQDSIVQLTSTTRPLPDPSTYVSGTNRTDRYLASNPAPNTAVSTKHRADAFNTTTEVDLEDERRVASQQKTKAGGWASKSLLEREMERERERQREWEENQKVTAARTRDSAEGSGAGQTWDIHQYGYMGGDSQNKGGMGLGTSGARRQIIGPRPPP